ncbi:hypothetical protein GZL_01408 [Streptomyces sp. 769]|nr:hypothetical protein GZL_01408 [Streptomyces sp. 769]
MFADTKSGKSFISPTWQRGMLRIASYGAVRLSLSD